MSRQYRRKRNLAWLLYLAVSALLYILISDVPEDSDLLFLGTLPILAFTPVLIYTGVLTRKARLAEDEEFLEEMHRRKVTMNEVLRFLTDKWKKGKEAGWAEDALIWLMGVPAVVLYVFSLSTLDSFAVKVIISVTYIPFIYCFTYKMFNRKEQRKRARLYALLFACAAEGEYSYPQLAAASGRHSAGYEIDRLLKRNYMMNLESDLPKQRVSIVGFRKTPRIAYVCRNCGGASSIPVGGEKICLYCGRKL